jgi:CDP-diacylglycerol--serine O-phosphatidyltransferase
LASFFYVVCGALRLARFNVAQSLAHDGPKSDFQGLPTPMAAGIVASSVLAFHDLEKDAERSIWILAITFLLGFVMVSTFRYRSFKDLDLRRRLPLYSLVIGVLIMIVVAINPEVMLFVLFLTYAVLGAVFGVLRLGRPIHGEVESESDLDQDTPPEPGSREHH